MGLRSFLFETSNPPRRCLIFLLVSLAAVVVGIWDGFFYDLKMDGPTICLENKAILRQEFNEDTLCTTLRAGENVKLLAIEKSSYGQEWLVETNKGNVGWIDAADLTQIRQILMDGKDEGDTVNIRPKWSGNYIYEYIYINKDGEENKRSTSDFIPVFDGWEDYVYNRGRISGVKTQNTFEKNSIGETFEDLNDKYGRPHLVHIMRDGFKVQYNWKALEPSTGKMWKTNVLFNKDSVATAVEFADPSSRAAGWLKVLPLSSFIVDLPITTLMVRGSRYEPMVFGVLDTTEWIITICMIPLILIWGYFWVFGTSTIPVLLMGWLLRFPKVFKMLSDKALMMTMFFVMLLSCYVWSIMLMAWGMPPIFALIILIVGWYNFSLAKSPLCQFPHERCPHCRELFSIHYDHRDFLKTEYEKGRDIIKGNKISERTEKWKRWTEVTTTKKYKSGRTETYTEKKNERTMARDYKTYLYFDYDLTYQVDHYRRYYKCDKCGFIEDDTTCAYKEIDRKFAGTHTAEIAGEEYEKPWYKR